MNEDYRKYCFDRAEVWGSDHQKKKDKKRPRGIGPRRFSPPPREQNMLRSLKIKALACVAKDTTSICLAERKPEVWGK